MLPPRVRTVAKAAKGVRAKLGESLGSIQKPDRPSADEVTTNSLEALKTYQLGYELLTQGSPREAIPQFQSAIEMDPNFAHAYEMLGVAYYNSGEPARLREYYSKAFALIGHVSERERLFISGQYYRVVTREMNKAIDAYQMDARTYPRFAPPHNGLVSLYITRGEYEEALEEAQEALRLEPRNLVFLGNLMNAYSTLDRFEEAKAVAEKAAVQRLDGPTIHIALLRIAYIQDDHAAQGKQIQWYAGKPDEYGILALEATNAWTHGQRRQAKDLYQRAAETARRQGLTDVQLGPPPALIDALVGDCEAARKEKSKPLLVFCGDASAVRLADESAKKPTPNPDAPDLLYVRGLADLNARKGAEAEAEFQRILDHKGQNWGPFYSLSYLGLARADVLAGDSAKAKQAYRDFFAFWKGADPDAPILFEARKEYAALN